MLSEDWVRGLGRGIVFKQKGPPKRSAKKVRRSNTVSLGCTLLLGLIGGLIKRIGCSQRIG